MKELERIGHRVDNLVDDMAIVKATQIIQGTSIHELGESMKECIQVMSKHVTGDEKIITELHPLLEPLKEIVLRRKIEEEIISEKARKKLERDQKIKSLLLRITLITGILGVLASTLSFLDLF